MNCTDVAAILDDHALTRLSAADRCALDEHVTGCEPCGFAWHAQSALLAMPLPPVPAGLLERMLRAVSSRSAPRAPRRARTRVVIIGALLAAGAALAAVTAVKMLEPGTQPTAIPAASDGARIDGASRVPAESTPSPDPSANTDATPIDVQSVDVGPFIALRTPPTYPPEALRRKLDGDVTLKFTIDEHGAVKDVEVIRSSDVLFEAAAVASLSQWKYLPRVYAGKRVAVVGIETVIRFTLEPPNLSPAQSQALAKEAGRMPMPDQSGYAAMQAVDRGIATAWHRVAADDLRGAELELDELRATYDLLDYQLSTVWSFYGYIYIEYGDYGRAIDAYEKAVASNAGHWTEPWTALANLYFARHQYDQALKTLLAYKQSGVSRINSEAAAMIEKLRALGVTEETL
jgi:TonB family protein